jgi:hypothetical protein
MDYYVLFSSTGNMIGCYDKKSEASAALQRIVAAEPEAVEDVALFSLGDDGMPVDGPVFATASAGSR